MVAVERSVNREYRIVPRSGRSVDIAARQVVTVIDVEGGQAAVFFAGRAGAPEEFLSPAVTLDCSEYLYLQVGDTLYSNLYRPMFTLVRDGMTCFYGNGTGHPNGHDNINRGLGERRAMMDRRIGAAACSVSKGECSAPVHGDSGDYRGIGRIKKRRVSGRKTKTSIRSENRTDALCALR